MRGGIYPETLNFEHSGTRDAPLTLSRYQDEAVVLDGKNLGNDGITVAGQFIVIDGFDVRNTVSPKRAGFGFVIWQEAADIVLRNMHFSSVGTVVKIGAAGGETRRSRITLENITATKYEGGGIDMGPGYVEDIVLRNIQLYGA